MNARLVGGLFILAFGLYGGGTALAMQGHFPAGVGLILANSVAVTWIGVLARPWLRPFSSLIANGYLAARVIEGLLLAAGALMLWARGGGEAGLGFNDTAYTVAMFVLAVGSLGFCLGLFRTALVPAWLALWGLGGYAVFGVGMILGAYGMEDLSMYLLIPGGLFELVFGLWLIIRGLKVPAVEA